MLSVIFVFTNELVGTNKIVPVGVDDIDVEFAAEAVISSVELVRIAESIDPMLVFEDVAIGVVSGLGTACVAAITLEFENEAEDVLSDIGVICIDEAVVMMLVLEAAAAPELDSVEEDGIVDMTLWT